MPDDLIAGAERAARKMLRLAKTEAETMNAEMKKSETAYGRFDVKKVAESFPPKADTLLLDTYLTNEPAASSRVFRVYRPTPAHYHATCDEYLYVLSGKGSFWLESPHNIGTFEPGQLLFFKKVWSMRCRICMKSRSSFYPSIHRDAIQRTSFSSIPKTERRRPLSKVCDSLLPRLLLMWPNSEVVRRSPLG
jgi:mannose-6-phosphate isomerase-like protein (cupin superfamily)